MKEIQFDKLYEATKKGDCFVEEKIEIAPSRKSYFRAKRVLDVIFSLIFIILAFLPSLILAILIKLTSRGPVFYLQRRVGQYGKEFSIIKFRTMIVSAEPEGPIKSIEEDPRVTKIGKLLRKTHIDEIPQLINILKGEMSFVGPRPERRYFYDRFAEYIDGFEQRLLVPQGLTGLAQIEGDYFTKPEKKIIYDIFYIRNASVGMDIELVFRTFLQEFKK